MPTEKKAKVPSTDKTLVGKLQSRYRKARDQRQKMDPLWSELDNFYRGEQYNDQKIPPWVPKPVTNFIHLVVSTKRAALALEHPSAILSAVAAEDTERIEELQRIYEWVWKKVKASRVVRQNIETSRLLGTGIAHVYWHEDTGVMGREGQYYEGEICIKELDPACFFPDPNADCIEDCQFIHLVEKKPRAWVESYFKTDLSEAEAARIKTETDIYVRDYYSDPTNGPDGIVELHTHYERYWNTEKAPSVQTMNAGNPYEDLSDEQLEEEEIGGWNYRCYYMVGDKIIKKIDKLKPNMYPFALLYDYKQFRSFWGKSTASLILDNQKLINKVESIIAMIGTLLQNPQKVVTKSSGISPQEVRKYSMAPGHTWLTNDADPSRSIRWQEVPQIPLPLFNLADAAKQNIREITGLNEAYMGGNVGSLQTSSGVNSLIDRATMRDKDQMVEIEAYIEQLSKLILGFVTTYYTDERYMKVIQDPANPNNAEYISFTGIEYKDLEFDFEINVSSRAPITLMRQVTEAKERLQLQGQYAFNPRIITPQEYVKDADLVDKSAIIDRMNKEEVMSEMQKIQTVLQMALEAQTQGIPPQEVMHMAQQQLEQMQQGQAPVDPFNPGNIPPGGEGEGGIGSAADNTGQMQQQQGELPPTGPPTG